MSSQKAADLFLEKAGIVLLPGADFGEYGEGYLRLTHANSPENIQLALEKTKAVL